jgi:uncharacterized protein DUF6265
VSVRLTILAAICFGSVAQAQDAVLDRARWLSGCWELRGPGRLTVEMWMPPAGNMMIGGSRTVVNGDVREFEHLRIKSDAGKLMYIALPSGQNETLFPAKEVSDSSLVFENLSHDFPQRIIYRKRGADSIVARIEGPGPNNSTRGFDFPMRRASCSG